MKRSMSEFIKNMCECDMEILEQLICLHYTEFTKLYRLIEDYANNIDTIKYDYKNTTTLDVYITFNKIKNMNTLKKELSNNINKHNYDCDIKKINDGIYISMHMN